MTFPRSSFRGWSRILMDEIEHSEFWVTTENLTARFVGRIPPDAVARIKQRRGGSDRNAVSLFVCRSVHGFYVNGRLDRRRRNGTGVFEYRPKRSTFPRGGIYSAIKRQLAEGKWMTNREIREGVESVEGVIVSYTQVATACWRLRNRGEIVSRKREGLALEFSSAKHERRDSHSEIGT